MHYEDYQVCNKLIVEATLDLTLKCAGAVKGVHERMKGSKIGVLIIQRQGSLKLFVIDEIVILWLLSKQWCSYWYLGRLKATDMRTSSCRGQL